MTLVNNTLEKTNIQKYYQEYHPIITGANLKLMQVITVSNM